MRPCLCALLALALCGCANLSAPPALELPYVVYAPEVALPAELADTDAAIDGEVTIMAYIGPDGQLTDTLVVRSTDPRLEPHAFAIMQFVRFEPGRVHGRVAPSHAAVILSFGETERRLTVTAMEDLWLNPRRNGHRAPLRVAQADELDHPPKLLYDVPPEFSGGGEAKLQYIIDRDGTVRMPMIVSYTDRGLAESALGVVSQWQFSPPLRRGEPAPALVSQRFNVR